MGQNYCCKKLCNENEMSKFQDNENLFNSNENLPIPTLEADYTEYTLPKSKLYSVLKMKNASLTAIHESKKESMDRVEIIKSMMSTVPTLNIDVVNSKNITDNKRLEVNPLGLQSSSKEFQNGYVYFGRDSSNPEIDFQINDENIEPGLYFQIYFDHRARCYFIQDLGKGLGTYLKITNSCQVKNNSLISIGNSFIAVTLQESVSMSTDRSKISSSTDNMLSLKVFTSQNSYEPINFKPSKKKIIVGRSKTSDLIVNDNILSRFHCFFVFSDNCWKIVDGYMKKKGEIEEYTLSTNGTWVYIDKQVKITNFVFKSNHILFSCSFS